MYLINIFRVFKLNSFPWGLICLAVYLPSVITYHPLPVFLDINYARNEIIPLPVFFDTNYPRNEIFILRTSQQSAIGQPTSHVTKCQPNPKSDLRGVHFYINTQMACKPTVIGQPTSYLTKCQPNPESDPGRESG